MKILTIILILFFSTIIEADYSNIVPVNLVAQIQTNSVTKLEEKNATQNEKQLTSKEIQEIQEKKTLDWALAFSIATFTFGLVAIIYRIFSGDVNDKQLRNSDFIKDFLKKMELDDKSIEENLRNQIEEFQKKQNYQRAENKQISDELKQKIEEIQKSYYNLKETIVKLENQSKNDKNRIDELRYNYDNLENQFNDLMNSIVKMTINIP